MANVHKLLLPAAQRAAAARVAPGRRGAPSPVPRVATARRDAAMA